MSDIIDRLWALASESVDILLVVALVCVVQAAKRVLPGVPSKAWMMANLAAGFLLAWIKVPVVSGNVKEYVGQAIIYAAGAELAYQGWRALSGAVSARIGHVPREKR